MKNNEYARDLKKVETLVAVRGTPVNEAMQRVSAITGWSKNDRKYTAEYNNLLECMQDYIKAVPAPAKNTVLIAGGTPGQRSRIAGMFVNLFAPDWVVPNDRVFTVDGSSNYAGYAGQPCIWYKEVTAADLLKIVNGRNGFLKRFEPWPHRSVNAGSKRHPVFVNNALNIVTTADDPHEFVGSINIDGIKGDEINNAGQVFRCLPIWFVIADDGSARICVNDQIIPHTDGDYGDYADLYALNKSGVDNDDMLSAVVENIAATSFFGGKH